MAFKITSNVKVRRDDEGRVCQLRHPRQTFSPADAALAMAPAATTPRALADQYVQEVLPIYQLQSEMADNLSAAVGTVIAQEGPKLRFTKEKVVKSQATVSYAQTILGLPVWEAGLTVRIQGDPPVIIGSQSSVHNDVAVTPPSPDSQYLPDGITEEVLAELLGLDPQKAKLSISGTRLIVYQYDPDDRGNAVGPPEEDDEENMHVCAPRIPLPHAPDILEAMRHYVVTEVLFSLRLPDANPLNWRAFIEPETGAVLNLEVFVGCVDGQVYLRDPVTSTGNETIVPTSPAVDLDAVRDLVTLEGLDALDPAGAQHLEGDFVRLEDLGPPNANPPVETAQDDFSYSVPTDDFSAVNAYYHCDRLFRMMQEMGFDVPAYFDGTNFPVRVDHRSRFGSLDGNEVNAQAPGNSTGNGSDGFRFALARQNTSVGIAADWRIVLHEFGHTLLWDNLNSPNFRFAHSAGDSLAAILNGPGSRSPDLGRTFPWSIIMRRHDRKVENGWGWGGARDDPFPVGHRLSRDRAGYIREQILSSTLFLAYRSIGGDHSQLAAQQFAARYMTNLIFLAIGSLSPFAPPLSGEDFASDIMEADLAVTDFEGHPGGAVHKIIRWAFEHQGAYQLPGAATPVMTAGAPRKVDVYVDDGRNGDYEPDTRFVADTTDVWTRRNPDGGTSHEAPVAGVPNFVYVRVRNRGTETAENIAAAAFSTTEQGDRIWPSDWTALDASDAVMPPRIAAGGDAIVGPFKWQPEDAADYALLLSVSADDDDSNADTVNGPIAAERLAHFDNNVVIRELTAVRIE